MSNVQLHFGDCLQLLDDPMVFPDNSVDAVVSDPPYGLTKDGLSWNPDAYEREGQKDEGAVLKGINAIHTRESILGDAAMNKKFEEWMGELAKKLMRIVKPGGFVALFSSCRTQHRVFSGFEDQGYNIRSLLSWIYATSVISKGRNIQRDAQTPEEMLEFMDMHTELRICQEPIMLAQKPCDQKTYAMNMRVWGVGALNIGETRFNGQKYDREEGYFTSNVLVCPTRGEQQFCTDQEIEYAYFTKRFVPNWSDMYLVPKPRKNEKLSGKIHPSVKPINLMEHLVRLTTRPGQKVLDMFLGSGTTLCATENCNRFGIGIEIEKRYESAIRDRLTNPAIPKKADAEGQNRMFEITL